MARIRKEKSFSKEGWKSQFLERFVAAAKIPIILGIIWALFVIVIMFIYYCTADFFYTKHPGGLLSILGLGLASFFTIEDLNLLVYGIIPVASVFIALYIAILAGYRCKQEVDFNSSEIIKFGIALGLVGALLSTIVGFAWAFLTYSTTLRTYVESISYSLNMAGITVMILSFIANVLFLTIVGACFVGLGALYASTKKRTK